MCRRYGRCCRPYEVDFVASVYEALDVNSNFGLSPNVYETSTRRIHVHVKLENNLFSYSTLVWRLRSEETR